jgi:immune inhibitor A
MATASLIGAAASLPLMSIEAGAAPNAGKGDPAAGSKVVSDSLTMPWQKKYQDRRQKALEKKLRSGSTGESVKVGKGAYGRVAQTGTDKIFVVLAEFGDTQHSAYAGQADDAQRVDGPLHNQIPKPNRSKDNSTNWQADYDQSHYQNLYFNRMKSFYDRQSSGKYSVDGKVTEWVKVPFNEARYGRDACGDIICSNTWFLIRDALAEWTKSKIDAGWSMERIQNYLKTFDHQDR